jgi:hypothetical protein
MTAKGQIRVTAMYNARAELDILAQALVKAQEYFA